MAFHTGILLIFIEIVFYTMYSDHGFRSPTCLRSSLLTQIHTLSSSIIIKTIGI